MFDQLRALMATLLETTRKVAGAADSSFQFTLENFEALQEAHLADGRSTGRVTKIVVAIFPDFGFTNKDNYVRVHTYKGSAADGGDYKDEQIILDGFFAGDAATLDAIIDAITPGVGAPVYHLTESSASYHHILNFRA